MRALQLRKLANPKLQDRFKVLGIEFLWSLDSGGGKLQDPSCMCCSARTYCCLIRFDHGRCIFELSELISVYACLCIGVVDAKVLV